MNKKEKRKEFAPKNGPFSRLQTLKNLKLKTIYSN